MVEEAVIAWKTTKSAVAPMSMIRSTLLSSSVRSLRQRGLEPKYLERLPKEYHETLLFTPAGVWVPGRVGVAHYMACDALGLDAATILEIGEDVATLTQKSVLSMMLRMAREAGVTPYVLYARCDEFWARIYQGSAIAIYRLGPKEARFEVAGCPFAQSQYWRTGLRGLLKAVTAPFAGRVYVRELPNLVSATSTGYRISWV